jgi:hypothetical protein
MSGTLLVCVKAQVLGVSQGNVFEYNIIVHWSSSSESTPATLLEVNKTKTLTVTVSQVSGSLISTKILTTYQNGTQTTADASSNVVTGEVTGLPFIGANLAKNDLVNPSATEHWYINETVTRTYQNETRETNHLIIEDISASDDVGAIKNSYEYYFDKSTGVLVQYINEISYGDTTEKTESVLLASNVWQVSADQIQNQDNPTSSPSNSRTNSPTILYIILAVVVILIAVIAIIFVLRKKKK